MWKKSILTITTNNMSKGQNVSRVAKDEQTAKTNTVPGYQTTHTARGQTHSAATTTSQQ